ncbi:hypothetical protein VNO77_25585 [Canavalia gladiata]|uniref:Transmembrane protein n=1 Tax=Canavalia gladiata TaxID=3824 RepID=A0AAN9L8E0_CANGL
MANLNQLFFNCICITLFLLLLFSYTVSSYPSTQHILHQNPPSTTPSPYHQVFYLNNIDPMFFRTQERVKNKRRIIIKRKKKNIKHRNKMMFKNQQQSRPFSAMLPKGFVPPSGDEGEAENERKACEFGSLGKAKILCLKVPLKFRGVYFVRACIAL